jgi:L-seryl-tRNA(Ser) seleniumtransferase
VSPKFQKCSALKFVGRTIPDAERHGIVNTNKISPRPSLKKRGEKTENWYQKGYYMDDLKKEMLKQLPKIDEVLLILEKQNIYELAPREIVKETCRKIVQDLRDKIVNARKKIPTESCPDAKDVAREVEKSIKGLYRYSLRRVVNATGVILHTNLGRAPLCPEALQRIVEVGRSYSNLEFDLGKGERGQRYDHVSSLICALTGAEDALIVNNNAAAVLLVLNTLAEKK